MFRVTAVLLALSALPQAAGTITIHAHAEGPRIPASLYGIFFEEINHAGEGGLYAELIQNRGFEDARLPPACRLENGFVIPPRTEHFWSGKPSDWKMPWTVTSDTPGWTLVADRVSAAIALEDDQPLTEASPHSLRLDVTRIDPGGRAAVVNEGFWGVGVRAGERYRLSFYARTDGRPREPVTASLEGSAGVLATVTIRLRNVPGWQRYEAVLTASRTDPRARFVLAVADAGRIWFDFVSLFPSRTWRDRPNGMRPDLAAMIAGLKPAFVRWPGGCFVEGLSIDTRPQWKRSIGRLEDRPGTYSPWGYWSSDGFGYHEFLQFAEDLAADALYVANVGVSCAFRSGTFIPDDRLDALVQDTLDAIEYAIGPPESGWGAVRAKNGHPAPFPLKYVEIGNEQQGARYGARVARFTSAIKARFPQIRVALSSWIAGIDRAAIDAAGPIDIVDEHAYKPLHWAIENFDSFAAYRREAWDLYIGEFATNGGVGRGNLAAALNDAAYMMSMEKNADLVKMGSYAPLLENVNKPDWQVNLIHFDSSRVYGRASYYANRLFAENRPDVNLRTDVAYTPRGTKPIAGRIGVGTYNTAAEFKDIVVERSGARVYASDFSRGPADWTPQGRRGAWSVQDGAYRQSEEAVAWSYTGDPTWQDITLSLKARKISGAEGFLVAVGTADGRRVQWNIGGWNNRRHAIQVADAVVGGFVAGDVETGRWYDVRVEVRDRTVRCFLDGRLVQQQTLPRVDTVLAIAGRDERTGEIVLKVVNSAPDSAPMSIVIDGSAPADVARLTVLASGSPDDENSFENPDKIAPRSSTIGIRGPVIEHTFPPYSLSIIRVKTSAR